MESVIPRWEEGHTIRSQVEERDKVRIGRFAQVLHQRPEPGGQPGWRNSLQANLNPKGSLAEIGCGMIIETFPLDRGACFIPWMVKDGQLQLIRADGSQAKLSGTDEDDVRGRPIGESGTRIKINPEAMRSQGIELIYACAWIATRVAEGSSTTSSGNRIPPYLDTKSRSEDLLEQMIPRLDPELQQKAGAAVMAHVGMVGMATRLSIAKLKLLQQLMNRVGAGLLAGNASEQN